MTKLNPCSIVQITAQLYTQNETCNYGDIECGAVLPLNPALTLDDLTKELPLDKETLSYEDSLVLFDFWSLSFKSVGETNYDAISWFLDDVGAQQLVDENYIELLKLLSKLKGKESYFTFLTVWKLETHYNYYDLESDVESHLIGWFNLQDVLNIYNSY